MIDWGTVWIKAMLAFVVVGGGSLAAALVLAIFIPPAPETILTIMLPTWFAGAIGAAVAAALREIIRQKWRIE